MAAPAGLDRADGLLMDPGRLISWRRGCRQLVFQFVALASIAFPPYRDVHAQSGSLQTQVNPQLSLQRLSEALSSGRFLGRELDLIWGNRHRLRGSLGEFARAMPELADEFEDLVRVSQLLAYVGYFVLPLSNKADRVQAFSLGFQVAERAIELNSARPDGYHWFAVNRMGYADQVGSLEPFFSARRALEALNTAVSLDAAFADGAALRARGRLYLKMPPAPLSVGDLDKALVDLRAALTFAPDDKLSLLALAIAESEIGNTVEARELLSSARASRRSAGVLEDQVIESDLDNLERKLK